MNDEDRTTEVNRLYWETDTSVGEIAERLGLSRRALYDALAPWPAGAPCPECGAGLVFSNRSRRSAGAAECPECGAGPDIALLRRATAEAGSALRLDADRHEGREPIGGTERIPLEPEPEVEQEWRAGTLSPIDADRSLRSGRAILIGAGALAGLVAGIVAVALVRRH